MLQKVKARFQASCPHYFFDQSYFFRSSPWFDLAAVHIVSIAGLGPSSKAQWPCDPTNPLELKVLCEPGYPRMDWGVKQQLSTAFGSGKYKLPVQWELSGQLDMFPSRSVFLFDKL